MHRVGCSAALAPWRGEEGSPPEAAATAASSTACCCACCACVQPRAWGLQHVPAQAGSGGCAEHKRARLLPGRQLGALQWHAPS